MKNNLFKLYILSLFLLSDFLVFAQPGDDDGGGGLEGGDPVPAAIDAKLVWLGIAAVIYAFYSFNRKRKIA
jgi:hypothetical protein